MTAGAVTGRPRRDGIMRLRRAAWYHPEWPVVLVALACWAALLMLHRAAGQPATHPHALPHTGPDANGWLAAQGTWLLMAAAMMLPSALPAVRHVAMNSKWRRRQRAAAVFVVSYLAVWMLFGVVAVSLARWVSGPGGGDTGWPLTATMALAAAWELTYAKRRWLRACHRTIPLPPDGLKADAACARFGQRYGWACIGAGWALMLPMAVAGHTSLLLMVVLTIIVAAEEVLVKGTRLVGWAALVLLLAAAVAAVR